MSDPKLRRKLKGRFAEKEDKPKYMPGLLGNGQGVVNTGTDGIVYVRVNEMATTAVCTSLPPVNDLPVWVYKPAFDKARLHVHSQRFYGGEDEQIISGTSQHAETHRYFGSGSKGGTDVLYVDPRQILGLRIYPIENTMTCAVFPWVVLIDGVPKLIGTLEEDGTYTAEVLDFAPYLITTEDKSKIMLVTLDNTGALVITEGAEVDTDAIDIETDTPAVPASTKVVIGAVRLYYGQYAIQEGRENTDLMDWRWLYYHVHEGGSGELEIAIDELSDVTISSPENDDLFQYDSGAWVNKSLSEAGIIEIIISNGSVSNPPTDAEIISILGTVSENTNKVFIIQDTDTGRYYMVISTGTIYIYTPFISIGEAPAPEDANYPDNAAWCWFSDPRAIYYNGKTYVGFLTSAGVNMVAEFTHLTDTFGDPVTVRTNMGIDDHAAMSILMRDSDKRLMAFYSAHNGSGLYFKISTNTEDASAWGSETNLDSVVGLNYYSYTMPIQLTGEENDPIYLFFRTGNLATNKVWSFMKSTDGGANWTGPTTLFSNGQQAYIKICQNGGTRIDFAISDQQPTLGASSIYHAYYDNGTWYDSAGSEISLPLTTDNMTLVYDGTTTRSWILDIAIEADGHPRILYQTHPTQWTDARYNWAIWDAVEEAWTSYEVAQNAGSLYVTEPAYTGGAILDPTDPNILYCSRVISDQYEIFKYVTADDGANWTPTAITSSSAAKNIRPFVPRNRQTDLKVIWLYGTYTSYTNFDMQLKGDDT